MGKQFHVVISCLTLFFCNTSAADEKINELDSGGFTRLHRAVIGGHLENVRTLLRNGANVEAKQAKFLGRPLQYAASGGHTAVAKLLLDADALIDSTDSFGRTPLIWAAQKSRFEVARLLVERKADVNARTNTGRTALHYARESNSKEIAQLLLENGARENVPRNTPPARHPGSSHRRSTAALRGLPPKPFLPRLTDESGERVEWPNITPTDLDIAIQVSRGLTRVEDDKLILPITIINRSHELIRSQLQHEWHGGEWPTTDLYASVRSNRKPSKRQFVPVYLAGKSNQKNRLQRIKPDQPVSFNIRLDWPGTGSVPAEPLVSIDQHGGYSIELMLVFHHDGDVQYKVSDDIPFTNLGAQLPRPQQVVVAPVLPEHPNKQEVARRKRAYRNQLDFLRIPDKDLPDGARFDQTSVYVPGTSQQDDAAFDLHTAFLGKQRHQLDGVEAVITAIYIDDSLGKEHNEIGVFAFLCNDETIADRLGSPRIMNKGRLLLYLWKDAKRDDVFQAIRMHFLNAKQP